MNPQPAAALGRLDYELTCEAEDVWLVSRFNRLVISMGRRDDFPVWIVLDSTGRNAKALDIFLIARRESSSRHSH